MENLVIKGFESGNLTAFALTVICYILVYFQRKNTATERNNERDNLQEQISKLTLENELLKKDVELLKEENVGLKADIKEIKQTLQQMAISLAKIAQKYEED